MVATFSNHSVILAIHETTREHEWLRFMIKHIWESCELSSKKYTPTVLCEDNIACVAQIKWGYIKKWSNQVYFTKVLLCTQVSEEWWNQCSTNNIKW